MKKKLVGAHDTDISKKYKILYETSSEALMTLVLPEAGFRNPNAAAVKMFRTGTKKKFTTLHPWDLSPKYQPDGELSTFKADRMITTALRKGSHFFEWTHKRYRGETFPATVLLTRMHINGETIIQATVRDMTEYKKLYVEVEALKKTQEELLIKNYVFNNAYTANSIANIKGQITEVNPYFLKIWGFTSKKEVIGRKIPYFFASPASATKVIESIRKNGHWSGDFIAKKKDGTLFVAYGRATTLRNEKDQVIGYQSTVYDVTAQRELSEQYENYINKSPRGIHMYSLEGNNLILIGTNPAADKILKIDHKPLIGKKIEDAFIAYQTDHRIPNIYIDIIKTGKVWQEEVPYNAGGIAGYFDVTAFRLSSNKMVATFTDISEKKQLEQELLLSKANDEAILQSIGDGMYVTDRQGTVMMVNKAFEELLGFTESTVLGKNINDMLTRQDEKGNILPLTKSALEDVLQGKKVKTNSSTIYYVRKDGTRFPVASVISPIEVENEVIGAVEVFKDITHEKEIDKAKTEFIMLASHQLRTPLSIINWYTNLLQVNTQLDKVSKEYVMTIQQSNKRMVELVNTLLSVSQMELGTYITTKERIDFPTFIQTIIQELTQQINEKKLHLTAVADGTLPKITFDPRLLRIIVENLVTNAIAYTPAKGNISITYTHVRKNEKFGGKQIAENSIAFAIQDTGYGIPKTQQKNIFQKLFRADNVRNLNTTGTGLGLYLTKSIVTSNGGSIWFISEENKGSVFYFTLPLK